MVESAGFAEVLGIYGLWPEAATDRAALLEAYAAPGGLVNYVAFCKDVEPRGHRGRDPVVRAMLEADALREPIPEVSICVRLAERRAACIRARRARDAERAKIAAITKADDRPSTPPGQLPSPAHRTLDIFHQFCAPTSSPRSEPARNTSRAHDPTWAADALSRRAKPAPMPFRRVFSL